jgi:hypothetical protein
MAFEQSHGKARPALPRASDLCSVQSGEKPPSGRTSGGHFAPGNRERRGAVKKSLGTKAATGEALVVARDARRLFGHPRIPSERRGPRCGRCSRCTPVTRR